MKKINERYREMGLDTNHYRVEALPTLTRPSLTRWKEIVDEFVAVGCRAIFLRKLDPFGFAAKSAKTLGYSMDEYLEFYANAVDYIIELNRQGVQVMERHAAIMLNKILVDEEPNYLDLRTPGGACIGQLGYAPDGGVYSSDEGRFVASMGDDMFRIGTVHDSYQQLMTNAATRALVMAGLNDGQPDCVSCVYKPWCGQQVEYNYKTQGSLHGHMRDSPGARSTSRSSTTSCTSSNRPTSGTWRCSAGGRRIARSITSSSNDRTAPRALRRSRRRCRARSGPPTRATWRAAAGSSWRSGRSSRRRCAAPTAASPIWCAGPSRSTKAGCSTASRRRRSVRRCAASGCATTCRNSGRGSMPPSPR